MELKRACIIGLGLIGGSIARALRERLGITDIVAVNRNSASIQQAVEDGVISCGFNHLNEYVFDSDIIFICTPVKRTMEFISALTGKVKDGCILTDVGSTKSEIVNYVNSMENAPLFLGGHPMAGSEKTGYSAGFSHLFENAFYVLTPCKTTTEESIELMRKIIESFGGLPVTMDPEEHDRVTGGISHVPHIIAATLVNLVRELDSSDGKMQLLAAGGFKDITRIASSSPEMWESIVTSNKHQIVDILENYLELVNLFKAKIAHGDSDWIYKAFESAKLFRDTFSAGKKGLISPAYELVVDVVDRPGIIGKIATLLGENSVNIKNINVSNSREYEQGCLRITLPDMESANFAFDLLAGSGYKVYK